MDESSNIEKGHEHLGDAKATCSGSEVSVLHDAASDARIRRKLDLHMMPLFFVLCKNAPTSLLPPVIYTVYLFIFTGFLSVIN